MIIIISKGVHEISSLRDDFSSNNNLSSTNRFGLDSWGSLVGAAAMGPNCECE